MKIILKNTKMFVANNADITDALHFTDNLAYVTIQKNPSNPVGSVKTSTLFKCSQKFDISGYDTIEFKLPIRTSSEGSTLGFGTVFYAADDSVCEVVSIPKGESGATTINMVIPTNAATVGFTWWIVDDYGDFMAQVS